MLKSEMVRRLQFSIYLALALGSIALILLISLISIKNTRDQVSIRVQH
jgi:hypothetical protein